MKKVFGLALFCFLLVGCMPTTLPAPIPSSSLTALPPTSTITPLLPTVTLTATITPTSTPNAHLTVNCLEIQPELPPDTKIKGTIALEKLNGPAFESFLLNMTSSEKVRLRAGTNQYLSGFAVSPDQKWLAYLLGTQQPWTSRLVVISPTGTVILDQLVSMREWFNLAGWVNNDHLIFSRYAWNKEYSFLVHPLDSILYNPFTREQQELSSKFPDIWTLESPLWGGYSLIESVYDPTLSYVVYPQTHSKIVLWNLKQNQQIIAFDTNVAFGSAPLWSPDGQEFLTNNSIKTKQSGAFYDANWEELFSIDKNGNVKQLTNLTLYYSTVQITKYSWSPNGRYVAFWMSVEPDTYPGLLDWQKSAFRLAVLDTQTAQVTNFCIRGGAYFTQDGGGNTAYYPPNIPIWSPDSTSLLMLSPSENSKTMVILVNVQQNYAVKIADDMIPMGWLTNEP